MSFYGIILALIIIVCILLALIVLVQNPKGGGLSSTFAGSNQVMGVRRTADFLEKATWTLAIALLVLSFVSVFSIPRGSNTEASESLKTEQTAPANNSPMKQTAQPQQQQQPQQTQPQQ